MDRKKIERMTKDEIKEYAEEKHGVELSTNDLKDEMIDQLMEAVESKKDKIPANKALLITIVVIVGVFAAIFIGNKLLNQPESRTYNQFHFTKEDMLWRTQVQKGEQPFTVPFYYPPWELEDITSDPDAEQLLLRASINRSNSTTVFVTLDPSLESKAVVAAVEISRITGTRYKMLNLKTHGALTREPENRTAETQNPIVTCAHANNETIVIWLKEGPNNVIYEEKGCIILQGTDEENLLRVADRFAYKLLGVMN